MFQQKKEWIRSLPRDARVREARRCAESIRETSLAVASHSRDLAGARDPSDGVIVAVDKKQGVVLVDDDAAGGQVEGRAALWGGNRSQEHNRQAIGEARGGLAGLHEQVEQARWDGEAVNL